MCIYYESVTEVCTTQKHLNQVCFETVEPKFFQRIKYFLFFILKLKEIFLKKTLKGILR